MGLKEIPWKLFTEKFLPSTLKMAGLSHTLVSRYAAARIVRAASNLAAEKNVLGGSLQQAYLELCQDTDPGIRKATLSDMKDLLRNLSVSSAESDFFPEVFRAWLSRVAYGLR